MRSFGSVVRSTSRSRPPKISCVRAPSSVMRTTFSVRERAGAPGWDDTDPALTGNLTRTPTAIRTAAGSIRRRHVRRCRILGSYHESPRSQHELTKNNQPRRHRDTEILSVNQLLMDGDVSNEPTPPHGTTFNAETAELAEQRG